jgi:bifunctional DNase/RNase
MPSNQPVVLLRESGSSRHLPIWVGTVEATAIAFALEGVTPPRPMTHDLVVKLIDTLGDSLSEVRVTGLNDGVFYASLVFMSGRELDCRPSDAIAIALRAATPITVADDVLTEAGINIDDEPAEPANEQEVEKFREFLEHISPEDFETGQADPGQQG